MSGGDSDGPQPLDPKWDMLRRYEDMVQTQIETLNGIDDKAAYVARLVAILIGILLSGASFVIGTDQVSLSIDTGAALLMLAVAVLAFFVSLVFAIITYLSSKFEYGPSSEAGIWLTNHDISNELYVDMMLRRYSHTIKANYRVVLNNTKRFKKCLASLLVGLLSLFGSVVLIVIPSNHVIDFVIVLLFYAGAAASAWYILEEEYLTLEW